MIDRSRPFPVVSTRVGRTDLGPGTAVIDNETMMVVIRVGAEDRPVRVPLSGIDALEVTADELVVSLRDGARVALVSGSALELRDELALRCRILPELTRALRTMGSRRGRSGRRATAATDQERFFAPLLEAKRRTIRSGATSATTSFDAESLALEMDNAVRSFAATRHGTNPPARRALEAELVDLSEPLRDVLADLKAAADALRDDPDDLPQWRVWTTALRSTFETADRVWASLDGALDADARHA